MSRPRIEAIVGSEISKNVHVITWDRKTNKFALIERELVKQSSILNRMKKYKDVSIFLFEFGPFLLGCLS